MADESSQIELERVINLIDSKLSVIEEKVTRLDHAVLGNSKPGLLADHRELEYIVKRLVEESEYAKNKKQRFNAGAWAVALLAIGQLFMGLRIWLGY